MESNTNVLPYSPGDTVWQKSQNREITLISAFMSAGRVTWTAQAGDIRITVPDCDLGAIPKLEKPLEPGDRIAINKVPWTTIRDAFPSLPGAKGSVARKIIAERESNGSYATLEDLKNRLGLAQVDWDAVGLQLDFSQ